MLPRLTGLSFSQKEVAAIQPLFTGTRVLSGSAATKKALLTEAPRYSILHLATHAFANQSDPMYSYLVLSPDGDSGLLYAHELYGADLRRLALVFLAGCETATGTISKSEGVLSVARPFLAAGVRAVVGTHWRVRDQPTALFSHAFYRQLLHGGRGAAEALRSAQIEMIRSGESTLVRPSAWSGFTLVGQGAVSLSR